ncbi:uncharacterized protein LOC143616209 [Bidens hawaiensis]|uniref:uncharacterized protein LOC143616209 n=1 Tax=Bidens hawaiensis TaxID=980011 RepID=UPI0040494DE1
MEASNITMFNDLNVSNNDCVLKVRILRLWRLKGNNKPGEDWSIEMILQDEMGDRMQAYARKACILKHDIWLAENRSLIVRKASLGANLSTYRYIYLTLWDDYLKQLTKYVADNPNEEYLIIALQFARLKYYGVNNFKLTYLNMILVKNIYVNNSYGNVISRLLINDYLYEVLDYKKRLVEISSQVHVEIPKPVGSSMPLTIKDEFLKNFPFYSISDLCTILEAKNVIIIGTAKAMVGNKEWYYNGCKRCSRKVSSVFVDEVTVYECKSASCNSLGVNAGPRFRIPIRVQDTTGVVSLTLFDRDARQLFDKAADHFVTTDVELDPIHTFPEELNIILEKKFAFIVEVSDYNIRNSYDVYAVSKLTDDEDVLNELDKQLAHGQPNDNQSLTIGSTSGLKSTEKDMCTPLSDQFTPISNSEVVIPDRLSSLDEKVISLPTVDAKLKRKLDDTYHVHEDTGMSATKTEVDEQPTVDANVGEGDNVRMQKI